MTLWLAVLCVGLAGMSGGFARSLLAGEFVLPETVGGKVFRPGWIGETVVGGVAAAVLWGIYGPLAGLNLDVQGPVQLTVFQVAESVVVGVGGGAILTNLAKARAEREARQQMADAAAKLGDDAAGKPGLHPPTTAAEVQPPQISAVLKSVKEGNAFQAVVGALQLNKLL
jgi:hypothetical protein